MVWPDENTLQTSANNAVDTGQSPLRDQDCEINATNPIFKFPKLWLNHVSDKIMILAFFVPVDDENTIIALRFYNRITGIKPMDKLIALLGSVANRVVERQDKRIVETQIPRVSALRIGERLFMADKPVIAYRQRREELQGRGEP